MTKKTSFQLKAEFCREYQLGIRTEVGGIQSDIVPLSEKLVTKIENPEYYILPKFDVPVWSLGDVLDGWSGYSLDSYDY